LEIPVNTNRGLYYSPDAASPGITQPLKMPLPSSSRVRRTFSGELLVGTCRVWRGATDGQGFTALTNNFETGGDGGCTGFEVNLIRSLAAGGAKDTSGFSNVIYAGRDGLGPLAPTGGHIWVSTNADAGPSNWVDHTGSVNSKNFPISAIAVDSSDVSGKTAFLTIMGFHVPHVWKTTNAGSTWTDFTANLEDAPVNSVTLTISASSTSVPGTVTVTIAGSTGGSSSQKSQKLSLTVVARDDFSISNTSGKQTVVAGQVAQYGLTVQPTGSSTFANPVHYSCATDTLPLLSDCSFDPNEIAAGTPATTVNLRLRTSAPDPRVPDPNRTPAGSYMITVSANSDTTSHVVQLPLTVTPKGAVDFSIEKTSGPQSVQAGNTASYTLNFAPLGDSALANPITYTIAPVF
jgi:hypothetical protein